MGGCSIAWMALAIHPSREIAPVMVRQDCAIEEHKGPCPSCRLLAILRSFTLHALFNTLQAGLGQQDYVVVFLLVVVVVVVFVVVVLHALLIPCRRALDSRTTIRFSGSFRSRK